MQPYFQITKVDEARREVGGILTCEKQDKDGDTLDYEGSKPLFQAWSNEIYEATKHLGPDGISYGNLREQHNPKSAVGKFSQPIVYDDDAKAIRVVAKVVDDEAWEKCLQGVYNGFSVGGKLAGSRFEGGKNFIRIAPLEASLVDNPALDSAHFDFVRAADGVIVQKSFSSKTAAEYRAKIEKIVFLIGELAVDKLATNDVEKREFSDEKRDELADKGKALPDGSFPIENRGDLENAVRAIGRAKDPAKAKAHIISRAKDLKATDLLPADWEGSTKEKSGLSDPTTGDQSTMPEVEKGTRLSLHDHLNNLKKAADSYHAAVHEHAEKCMKLAGGGEPATPGVHQGGQEGVNIGTSPDTEVKAAKAEIEKLAATVAKLTETIEKIAKPADKKDDPVVGDRENTKPTGTTDVEKAAAARKERDYNMELAKAAFPSSGHMADQSAMAELYKRVVTRVPEHLQ